MEQLQNPTARDSEDQEFYGSTSEPEPARRNIPKIHSPQSGGVPDADDLEYLEGLGFISEEELARRKVAKQRYRQMGRYALGILLVGALAAAVGFSRQTVADASLSVTSEPAGIEVRIGNVLRGRTPLRLAIPPGEYTIVVGPAGRAKEHRVTLRPAESVALYQVASPETTAATVTEPAQKGAVLSVVTDPGGGSIVLDGVARGSAPLVVENLAAGKHRLVVRSNGAVYEQNVVLQAGETSTVMVGGRSPSSVGGWLAVSAPLPLQIRENGRLLGTSESDRLMLPAGEHQLELANDASGFRLTRAVRIMAGETASVPVQVPSAAVNVNATPWADVWIDGEHLGETPIANRMLPIGAHDVELRHPELGTKRMSLVVALNRTNRIATNMRAQ